MSQPIFAPSGNTVLVAASSSTSIAATQLSTTDGVVHAVRLVCPTTGGVGAPVYVAIGSSAVGASVPSTATPSAGTPMAPGSDLILHAGPNITYAWLSAVTSAGTASLFATPGALVR